MIDWPDLKFPPINLYSVWDITPPEYINKQLNQNQNYKQDINKDSYTMLDEYQNFIALSRYSRWNDDLQRRETWSETVQRLAEFWHGQFPEQLKDNGRELWDAIHDMEVMPSMRSLACAGKALERDNVAGFNCSYVAVDNPRVFDEVLYVLCCGTGVGFSVERQYVNKLPEIAEDMHPTETTIIVSDSKIGWAKSYRELISLLYQGQIPKWDTSRVRPAGSRLKTFGGRASGPAPLENLFQFTVDVFRKAVGRKLTSIECHDLMCKVAEIVVVGGVRRSALISLSNLSDERMRHAKAGQWWIENAQRSLANNSVCYTEKPDMTTFMREWLALTESGSGERGIFNREAANKLIPQRRKDQHTSGDTILLPEYGTNPCSEIILRSKQFCNLSEVVVRPSDTYATLAEKVRKATIIGTLQASLTNFRYLSSAWTKNTEEEALLGVSMTGIMDHPFTAGKQSTMEVEVEGQIVKMKLPEVLRRLQMVAVATNAVWADKLGINPAAAITAVKPSGTVSQLVDSASGIHPRYSEYYIRTVRADKKDPLAQMMVAEGFPVEDDVMKPDTGYVFSFPKKAPKAVMRDDMTAIDQLESWKVYQENWTEHKPSITVYVREGEWMEVGAWVYANFDIISGVSFLPHSDHTYQQAPYQEITKKEYQEALTKMPKDVDWSKLSEFEKEDMTEASHELACSAAGGCEI